MELVPVSHQKMKTYDTKCNIIETEMTLTLTFTCSVEKHTWEDHTHLALEVNNIFVLSEINIFFLPAVNYSKVLGLVYKQTKNKIKYDSKSCKFTRKKL